MKPRVYACLSLCMLLFGGFLIGTTCSLTRGPLALRNSSSPWRMQHGLKAAVKASPNEERVRLVDSFGRLPLSFEANEGQTNPRVKFLSRGQGYTLFLTRSGEAILALRKSDLKHDQLKSAALVSPPKKPELEPASPSAVVRMKLVGGNARSRVEGIDELPSKTNYFIGNDPKKWGTNVPMFAGVKYRSIYPGVDLAYYGNQRQLEHDFIVAPGADAGSIRMSFDGAEKLFLDTEGNLVLVLKEAELRFQRPVIYQKVGGVRHGISGGYVLRKPHEVAFQIAAYDATKPLIIDPALFYSTYLGGSGFEQPNGIAVDSSGNAYVTGITDSIDFPTMTPIQAILAGGRDVFVAKLNPTGSALVYSTYLAWWQC